MPKPGLRWRFVTINTLGAWHHRNPRGFRSRGHRIHSSGDYRNPPSKGEHAGLHQYRKKRQPNVVRIPTELRSVVGEALVVALIEGEWRILAVSVSSDHAHLLVELPDDVRSIKAIIGDAKRRASRAIKAWMPGSVWSEGCDYEPVDDPSHQKNAVNYVLHKQGADSWTWSFREPAPTPTKPKKPGRR